MNQAGMGLIALSCAVFICAGEAASAPQPVGRARGVKHFAGGDRGDGHGGPVVHFHARAPFEPLRSGSHNPTVVGGPSAEKNIFVGGQPLKGTRSTASVGGTVRNRGRY